jgi:hypothetical protein
MQLGISEEGDIPDSRGVFFYGSELLLWSFAQLVANQSASGPNVSAGTHLCRRIDGE